MAAKWLLPAFFACRKTICILKAILDTVLICCDLLNQILRPKAKAKRVLTLFLIKNNVAHLGRGQGRGYVS